jgi:hypothetical protein
MRTHETIQSPTLRWSGDTLRTVGAAHKKYLCGRVLREYVDLPCDAVDIHVEVSLKQWPDKSGCGIPVFRYREGPVVYRNVLGYERGMFQRCVADLRQLSLPTGQWTKIFFRVLYRDGEDHK